MVNVGLEGVVVAAGDEGLATRATAEVTCKEVPGGDEFVVVGVD